MLQCWTRKCRLGDEVYLSGKLDIRPMVQTCSRDQPYLFGLRASRFVLVFIGCEGNLAGYFHPVHLGVELVYLSKPTSSEEFEVTSFHALLLPEARSTTILGETSTRRIGACALRNLLS
jgi:hypothetical protein